jgi:hypothetical protein
MNVDRDVSRLVEPSARRAGEIFTKAMQKFINDERRRRPKLQAFIALCAAADGLGMAMAAAMIANKPDGAKDSKGMLRQLLELARIRGEAILEWDADRKPLP